MTRCKGYPHYEEPALGSSLTARLVGRNADVTVPLVYSGVDEYQSALYTASITPPSLFKGPPNANCGYLSAIGTVARFIPVIGGPIVVGNALTCIAVSTSVYLNLRLTVEDQSGDPALGSFTLVYGVLVSPGSVVERFVDENGSTGLTDRQESLDLYLLHDVHRMLGAGIYALWVIINGCSILAVSVSGWQIGSTCN